MLDLLFCGLPLAAASTLGIGLLLVEARIVVARREPWRVGVCLAAFAMIAAFAMLVNYVGD